MARGYCRIITLLFAFPVCGRSILTTKSPKGQNAKQFFLRNQTARVPRSQVANHQLLAIGIRYRHILPFFPLSSLRLLQTFVGSSLELHWSQRFEEANTILTVYTESAV